MFKEDNFKADSDLFSHLCCKFKFFLSCFLKIVTDLNPLLPALNPLEWMLNFYNLNKQSLWFGYYSFTAPSVWYSGEHSQQSP